MKGNAFSDRVRLVTEWFQSWNSCEQTIALYSLLSKITPTQARFLSLVLDHSLLNGFKSAELSKLENEANNATFLSSLHSQTEEAALGQLLTHLPLLNPSSADARAEYMKLLPKVMLGSSEELNYLDQCRQLLSLALVHPAFPQEDREALTFWFSQLDRKQRNIVDRKPPSPTSRIFQIKSSPEDSNWSSVSSGRINISGELRVVGESDGFSDDEISPPLNKSNSLPVSGLQHSPASVEEHSLSYEDYLMTHMNKIGFMTPSSSMTAPATSSGEIDNTVWKDGMKDVPLWLKSLRLHKYQGLFSEMEYEQMLTMTEDYLTERGVTKGARTKIILSIRKLARRPETIVEIEQDMEKAGRLISCVQELRQMLLTPIKPYTSGIKPDITPILEEDKQQLSSDSELEELLAKDFPNEDLPSLMTRAMAKGFSQLMGYTDTNEENLGAFVKLLDSSLTHEVFTVEQKQLIFDWKQQCTQNLRMMSPKKSVRSRNLGGFHTIGSVPPLRGSKSRSLRAARIGPGGTRTLTLPAFPRSSSTLPRMSARQLQQAPLPTSAFLRPKSLLVNGGGKFPLTAVYNAPPPLPPRSTPVDTIDYTNDLPQRVAEHALDDTLEV